MKILGGKLATGFKELFGKAKQIFNTQTTRLTKTVEEFTITIPHSKSSKPCLSRRERNYKTFRKHRNQIAAMSRKINYGIK